MDGESKTRKNQKRKKISGSEIFLLLICLFIVFWVMNISKSDNSSLNLSPTSEFGTVIPLPVTQHIQRKFNPPAEVKLIPDDAGLILIGVAVPYLIDYEKYHWSISSDERARLRKIYDKGFVFYISGSEDVLLMEIDGDFAKIQIPIREKSGWIRKSDIESIPLP